METCEINLGADHSDILNNINDVDRSTNAETFQTNDPITISAGGVTKSTRLTVYSGISGDQIYQGLSNAYDAPTNYSPSNRTDLPPFQEAYVLEFAGSLFETLRSNGLSDQALGRVSEVMVESLKGFASRFGRDAKTQDQRDAVYFTHKRRK